MRHDVLDAMRYAEEKHRGQWRKYHDGVPYICHPRRVAKLIFMVSGLPPEAEIAAVLHDVIEETDVSPEDLRRRFGSKVADLVVVLTDPPDDDRPRRERKAGFLERLKAASPLAQLIKVADRLDNLRDCPLDVPEARRFLESAYLRESRALAGALVKADDLDRGLLRSCLLREIEKTTAALEATGGEVRWE